MITAKMELIRQEGVIFTFRESGIEDDEDAIFVYHEPTRYHTWVFRRFVQHPEEPILDEIDVATVNGELIVRQGRMLTIVESTGDKLIIHNDGIVDIQFKHNGHTYVNKVDLSDLDDIIKMYKEAHRIRCEMIDNFDKYENKVELLH